MRRFQQMLNSKMLNPYDKNRSAKKRAGDFMNFLEDFMDYIPDLWVSFDLFKRVIREEYVPKFIKNHHIKFFKENKKAFEKVVHTKITNENFGGSFYEIDL